MIDNRAVIDPSAKIDPSVKVGPFSVIGANVEIGAGTEVRSHVVVGENTKIGKNNKLFQFSSVGEEPQDKTYQGELTHLEVGDDNIIREFCTISRGTTSGRGMTSIGNGNMLMAYVHIAHDCDIKNHTIFINNASLAGHVRVEDHAVVGAFVGVHQFTSIGPYSFLARAAMIGKDVPPFVIVAGNPATVHGLNNVGLRRAGFGRENVAKLREAYRILYRKGLSLDQSLEELNQLNTDCEHVRLFIDAIEQSKRGIMR